MTVGQSIKVLLKNNAQYLILKNSNLEDQFTKNSSMCFILIFLLSFLGKNPKSYNSTQRSWIAMELGSSNEKPTSSWILTREKRMQTGWKLQWQKPNHSNKFIQKCDNLQKTVYGHFIKLPIKTPVTPTHRKRRSEKNCKASYYSLRNSSDIPVQVPPISS